MLKKRLIPKLQLITNGEYDFPLLVTTCNFKKRIEIGDPVSQAKIFQAQLADELIFLDISPTDKSIQKLCELASRVSEEVFMPITIGGGIRELRDIELLLKSGADKVSINTQALENPSFVNSCTENFGSQCIVVSIDYKVEDGIYFVYSNSGTKRHQLSVIEWSNECYERGAGELLLTSIDRDGLRVGLDCEITRSLSRNLSIPIISSGGCGLASHFVEGYTLGAADAIAAGTYFCMKDENPMQCRAQIKNAGIPIRVDL